MFILFFLFCLSSIYGRKIISSRFQVLSTWNLLIARWNTNRHRTFLIRHFFKIADECIWKSNLSQTMPFLAKTWVCFLKSWKTFFFSLHANLHIFQTLFSSNYSLRFFPNLENAKYSKISQASCLMFRSSIDVWVAWTNYLEVVVKVSGLHPDINIQPRWNAINSRTAEIKTLLHKNGEQVTGKSMIEI